MPSGFVILANVAYPVLSDEKGAPLYRQTPIPFFPPQVAQQEVTEAQFPPEARVPYSFRDLSGGPGQVETPIVGINKRYRRIGDTEGEGIDATLTPDGPVILAAQLNTQIHPIAGTGHFLGAIWKGGSNSAYFAQGNKVYSWTGTAFANVGDLGIGNLPTDSLLLYRNVQMVDYWYALLGYTKTPMYSTDNGISWTPVGTSGQFDMVASAVVHNGDVILARASRVGYGNTMVCSMNDGGTAPTIFGVIDPVGNPAFDISRLMVYQNRVYVLKDGEGVFLLTGDHSAIDQELFPELHGAKLYYAGATVWWNILWLPTDRGLFAITSGNQLNKAGPERLESTATQGGRGVITAVAGDTTHLYGFRDAGAGNIPFIYKADVSVAWFGLQDIVWHAFLQAATGAQCQHMQALAPGNNGPKILLDFQTSAGLYNQYWFKTPARGRDPRQDENYRYAGAGTLYYSRLTARFPFANKTFFGMTPLYFPLNLALDEMTPTTALTGVDWYKLDSVPLTANSPFGYTVGASQISGQGVRDAFALRGRGLDTAVRLSSSDPTQTPQLQTATVDYDVEPNALWKHIFSLDISSGATVNSGQTNVLVMTPAEALEHLRQLPGNGPVSLTDLWDNTYQVTIPFTGIEAIAGGPQEEGQYREIPLRVNVTAIEQTSAVASGTYGALGSYTYGSLSSAGYDYSSLTSL